MIKCSKDKVLLLHKLITQETGGSIGVLSEDGLWNLLTELEMGNHIPLREAAVTGPQSFQG